MLKTDTNTKNIFKEAMEDIDNIEKLKPVVLVLCEIIHHMVKDIRKKCEKCMTVIDGDECPMRICPIYRWTQFRKDKIVIEEMPKMV